MGKAARKKSDMIDMTGNMSLDVEVSRAALTSLRDDNPFKLTFAETLPWRLIIPSLVEMRSALEYPYEAYDDIAYNQEDYRYLKRTDGRCSDRET